MVTDHDPTADVAVAGHETVGGSDPPTFVVSGSVDGLYPGASLTLPVTLENPYADTMLVQVLEVGVDDGGPNCPAELITISELGEPAVVDAGSSATVQLVIELAASAPDACQGAEFPLHYAAAATVFDEGSPVPPPGGGDGGGGDGGGGDGPGGLVPTGSDALTLVIAASALVLTGWLLRRRARHRPAEARP